MAGFYCCLRGSAGDYIMATGLPDTRQASETEEFNEERSGKKKSKFKTFKNFFAKKKRKVTSMPKGENRLKPSQSSTDVSTAEPSEARPDSETGSQSNIGNRAFSHDSIFIPELSISEAVPVRGTSQENMAGRVKALQLQLEQNIRLASPSVLISSKKNEDAGTMSEDDGLPRSPPEISSLHAVLRCSTPKSAAPIERHNSLSLGGTESEDEELISSVPSSRPLSPLVLMTTSSDSLPVDFSSPVSSFACLDNSAAKHKIAVNPRRHKFFAKQRKPTIREDSGSPKARKFNLLEKKDEMDQFGATANLLLNENKQKIDPLADGESDIRHNKMPYPKFVEMNDGESTEKTPKVSGARATSDGQSPGLEDTFDGETTNLNGDTLPNPTSREIFFSEPVFTSEDLPDPEKTPSVTGLAPETFPVHEEDSESSSVKAIADKKEKDALPSCAIPVVVTASPDCSENKVHNTDIAPTSENPLFEDVEGDMVSLSAANRPSLKSNSAALLHEEREKGIVLNILIAPEHSLTSKQTKSGTLSDEMLASSKECKGYVENILTDQSIMEETDAKNLLNRRPEHIPKPCNELTDSVGFISEVLLEDSAKQHDLSTPRLVCSQAQPELSISHESSQEHHRPDSQGSIKFSIASAWQRSMMDAKKKNMDCSLLTVPKPVHGENTSEGNATEALSRQDAEESISHQQILSLPLKVKPDENGPVSTDNCLQDIEQEAKTGQGIKGSPFGVRLRKTSPLSKYSTEDSFEHKAVERRDPMGGTSCLATQSPVLWKGDGEASGKAEVSLTTRTEKDVSKHAAKSLPEVQRGGCLTSGETDSPDTSTEPVMREKYHVPPVTNERKNSETYLDFGKTSERSPQPTKAEPANNPRVNTSEPVWVSLARQKQKGFQGQYSGTQERAQFLEDKSLLQTDVKKEATKHVKKIVGDKEPLTSFQNKELKINVKEEHVSRITTPPALAGSHLQPKPQSCEMGMREKRPVSNTKLAPLAAVEPPWLAIAKKKAKAWSDMPQTVQ